MFYAIFSKNMGFGWPILHQSWVQIGFIDLENNLDDLHVNEDKFWHQEVAKIRQNTGKSNFEGYNIYNIIYNIYIMYNI